jgi:hypothetical protein
MKMFRERYPLLQASEEDAAAQIIAPGQEAFKTPDVSKPAEVSDDSSEERFGKDVNWDEVVDEGDEPQEDISEAVASSEEEQQPPPPEMVPEGEDKTEESPAPEAAISDEDAQAAIAEEQDDFQPETIESIHSPESGEKEGWEEEYRTSREGALKELEGKYQLNEEEADLFLTRPGEIVPQMAARIYVDVFESVLGAVNQMLPVKVGELSAVTNQAAEYTRQFYEAWPQLKTEEGQTTVNNIAKVYRQLNQTASPEDFMRDVGTQAVVALKLPIPGVTDVEAPAEQEAPKPFTPSGAAAAVGDIPDDPRQSGNQFERLHAEWDEDD